MELEKLSKEELQSIILDMKKKETEYQEAAEIVTRLLISSTDCKVSDFCKMLTVKAPELHSIMAEKRGDKKIGSVIMFRILREKKLVYMQGTCNVPYQTMIDSGYMYIRLKDRGQSYNGVDIFDKVTILTPKGQ